MAIYLTGCVTPSRVDPNRHPTSIKKVHENGNEIDNEIEVVTQHSRRSIEFLEDESSDKSITYDVKICGWLHYPDSNRFVLDGADQTYILEVNCPTDNLNNGTKNKTTLVSLSASMMLPQQRGKLSFWKSKAVEKGLLEIEKNGNENLSPRNFNPWICVKGEVTQMICDSASASRFLKISNMTSRMKEVEKW